MSTGGATIALSLDSHEVIPTEGPVVLAELDPTDPLTARNGTTSDGRTYGPMPMPESAIDTPEEWKQLEALMPDLIPVLNPDGQSIAGYADRRLIEAQRSNSKPIEIYDDDLATVVGYWHFAGGFRPIDSDVPASPMSDQSPIG